MAWFNGGIWHDLEVNQIGVILSELATATNERIILTQGGDEGTDYPVTSGDPKLPAHDSFDGLSLGGSDAVSIVELIRTDIETLAQGLPIINFHLTERTFVLSGDFDTFILSIEQLLSLGSFGGEWLDYNRPHDTDVYIQLREALEKLTRYRSWFEHTSHIFEPDFDIEKRGIWSRDGGGLSFNDAFQAKWDAMLIATEDRKPGFIRVSADAGSDDEGDSVNPEIKIEFSNFDDPYIGAWNTSNIPGEIVNGILTYRAGTFSSGPGTNGYTGVLKGTLAWSAHGTDGSITDGVVPGTISVFDMGTSFPLVGEFQEFDAPRITLPTTFPFAIEEPAVNTGRVSMQASVLLGNEPIGSTEEQRQKYIDTPGIFENVVTKFDSFTYG